MIVDVANQHPTEASTAETNRSTARGCLLHICKRPRIFVIACAALGVVGWPTCTSCWSLPEGRTTALKNQGRRYVVRRILTVGIAIPAAAVMVPLLDPSTTTAAWARNLPEPTMAVQASRTGTAETLEPILKLKTTLKDMLVRVVTTTSDTDSMKKTTAMKDIFQMNNATNNNIPTTEKQFKALFDAYSDPVSYQQTYLDQNAFLVYYTQGFDGPGRPALERDPTLVRQTLQYGARNDAWVAWDSFLVELKYQQQQQQQNDDDDEDAENAVDELQRLLQNVIDAVDSYLSASGIP